MVGVLALLALQAGGCVKAESSNDTPGARRDTARAPVVARDRSTEDSVPDKLLTVTESSPHGDGLTITYLPLPPVDEALLARARALLVTARPGFHEWPPSAYAAVHSDSTLPTTTGPLVGDFDGDGMTDVVFDGYDGRVMVTPAVLSNRGQPKIVSVEEGFEVPGPLIPIRTRFVLASYRLRGRTGLGVGFVSFDGAGKAMIPASIRVYADGYFAELIEGE